MIIPANCPPEDLGKGGEGDETGRAHGQRGKGGEAHRVRVVVPAIASRVANATLGERMIRGIAVAA